jgi:membrane protease YdiL (CAAX protease family)
MAWLYRLALQLGIERPSVRVLAMIVALTALEELTWRGLVLTDLTERLGTRRAWPLAALLYALCHAPTLQLLSHPGAGLNPLVVLGALGAGLVWSFMTFLLGRLPPVMVSHAVFSYFAVTMLLPRFG